MENATKALLIAAAVLVAIIIISLTLGVVNQGREAISSADMSQAEIDAYNAKFLSYESTNASVADVNALLSAALTHNQNQAQQQTGRSVTVTVKDGNTEKSKVDSSSTSVTRITGSDRYTVVCTLEKGLVKSIAVTKK